MRGGPIIASKCRPTKVKGQTIDKDLDLNCLSLDFDLQRALWRSLID